MKILEKYADGSRTIIYEPGDRVRLIQVSDHDNWLMKVGELATVIRHTHPRERANPSSINFLDIRTDAMIAGNWGATSVPPWFLEFVGESISRLI